MHNRTTGSFYWNGTWNYIKFILYNVLYVQHMGIYSDELTCVHYGCVALDVKKRYLQVMKFRKCGLGKRIAEKFCSAIRMYSNILEINFLVRFLSFVYFVDVVMR